MREGSIVSSRKPAAGMALVVTLALIVLITVVVLAFFVHTTANRKVEISRVNRIKATLLADSARAYTTSLFLGEIADPVRSSSQTVSGIAWYAPLAASNAIPQRLLASSIPPGDTNFFSLVRQSVQGIDPFASAHSTAEPAKNGRALAAERWNAPRLVQGTGFATNQLPNWIYVTRDGGLTATPTTNVVGRFAYNAYDVGGLLDVNVAGFPASPTPAQLATLKGTAAGADLSRLSGVSQSEVNALVGFRNPGVSASLSSYLENVQASLKDGFLSLEPVSTNGTAFTNNYFVSRQDLLRYVRTQNPPLTNALPYLTHFSRTVAAPTWTPAASPANSNPSLLAVRFSGDSSVAHFNDSGGLEPYSVRAGQPLLLRRFSLAKLAWLTPTGPAAGISDEAIQSCFGLRWNGDEDRWEYAGPSGTAATDSISDLGAVAAGNREPNFFELLKAGILTGSLGQSAGEMFSNLTKENGAGDDNLPLEQSKDLQILRIGANIIDCADADNYPTIVGINVAGVPIEVAGVEDLPYFFCILTTGMRQFDLSAATPKITAADIVWTPILFNPHRPSGSSSGPASISLNVLDGYVERIRWGSGTPAKSLLQNFAPVRSVAGVGMTIASGTFEGFRGRPSPARSAAGPLLGAQVSYTVPEQQNINAFRIFSYQSETALLPKNIDLAPGGDGTRSFRVYLRDFIVSLQYPAASGSGRLKTYATFCGNPAFPGSGMNGAELEAEPEEFTYFGPNSNLSPQVDSLNISEYCPLWDPRTNRMGPPALARHRGVNDIVFFAPPASNSRYWWAGLMPQGGLAEDQDVGGVVVRTNPRDPDGTVRPADGWLSDSANPYRQMSGANLDTGSVSRPLLLQRPYRSVAELGYVFRDNPWKSLNLSDARSADGALLDLFAIADEPAVVAGRSSLANRFTPVLESFASGAAQEPDGSAPVGDPAALAAAVKSFSFVNEVPTPSLFQNPADLPRLLSSTNISGAGLDTVKNRREAAVRALADTTQTRTWNILVDVIAQAGRFPSQGPTGAGDFLIEGESRCWISLAVDRYSSEIVAQQTEFVHE